MAEAGRLTLAPDYTPTEQYGLYDQVAGIHYNPPPGADGSPFLSEWQGKREKL
jgi:hypothetical protein